MRSFLAGTLGRPGSRFFGRRSSAALLAGVVLALAGCGPSAPARAERRDVEPAEERPPAPEAVLGSGEVATVEVDTSAEQRRVAPHAYGIHASVYDNALHDGAVPALLTDAGIALVRWPGGGYSDNYHWSTHQMTPWADRDGDGDPEFGYLADDSDFGSFARLIDSLGVAAMITVNYGSNLQGTGPGEPKEAAAWVAYANGEPDDATPIGEDSSGNDWKTVGYWASLRASAPLADDDGSNFLRIEREEPLAIPYWEIGNELFGNGFHAVEFELDLHVPYDGTRRRGHPDLSGTRYGQGVSEYVREMKAVDPSIRIGAVLGTPPVDNANFPTWNRDVLAECARDIDFAIVHWYAEGAGGSLLHAPRRIVPVMVEQLRDQLATFAGDHAPNVELAMTELGPLAINEYASYDASRKQVAGLFASEVYLRLMQHGFFNVDWLELHNGSFLDEDTQEQGAAYHGMKLAHHVAGPGDTFVSASSSHPASIIAQAARRGDGKLGLLLINTDANLPARVRVHVQGSVIGSGVRHDYAPERGTDGAVTAPGHVVGPVPLSGLDDPLELELEPYSASAVVLDSVMQ